MIRATIFDYGAGNLHSLSKALTHAGAVVSIASDPLTALESDVLVLPGVGNFVSAAARLAPATVTMRDAISGGHPTLGICLGMQLLFESSEEGPGDGLGVLPGSVRRLQAARVPQIGWNAIEHAAESPLAQCGLDVAYYANSFQRGIAHRRSAQRIGALAERRILSPARRRPRRRRWSGRQRGSDRVVVVGGERPDAGGRWRAHE